MDLGLELCKKLPESADQSEKKRRVLVIGLDGTRPDAVIAADAPTLNHLIENGSYTLEATTQTVTATSSSPGWLSIMRGVSPLKHKVLNNGEESSQDSAYKSFLWHAKNDFGLKTMAVASFTSSAIYDAMVEDDAVEIQRNKYDHFI